MTAKRWLVPLMMLLLMAMGKGACAQSSTSAPKTRVLLIVDCSNSMWEHWQSESKIKVTQQVLLKFLDTVASQNNIEVALRVFGHLNKHQFGTHLEVPFEADNNYRLQSKIKTLVPQGGCTAATALTDALHDFPKSEGRNIILIITDGMDDCDAAICQVARQVQLSGVVVQTFILGIGDAKNFQHSLDCAGKFTHVGNEEDYTQVLYDIFHLSDQKAQVVVQVQNSMGQMYEDEIPIAFYDNQTHVVKYSTICTINAETALDTLELDPLVSYDVTFFTRPAIQMQGISFSPNKVNNLTLTADQGVLRVRRNDKRVTWPVPNYQVIVRRHGEKQLLHTQQLGDEVNYCEGRYDLEVLSQPIMQIEDVVIQESASTDINIPMPGLLNLTKPKVITTGSIFTLQEGTLKWVCDLNPNNIVEKLVLMPGEYLLMLHPQGNVEHKKVEQRRFQIESAQQTNIVINK